MILRPYQQRAIDELRKVAAKRPVLVAPCGAGKTTIAAAIIKSAIARGRRAMFVVHRIELVTQAARRLSDAGLDPRLIISGKRTPQSGECYVASLQTLVRREPPQNISVIIADECHHARSATWERALAPYPSATLIGLTATPYRLDRHGLGRVFGALVIAATYDELFREGQLVKPRVYAPSAPSESIRTSGGEFVPSSAGKAMSVLTGDIVSHWHRLAQGHRTVIYACTIEHAEQIAAAFGSTATVIHSKLDRAERKLRIRRLQDGSVPILVNCEILTEGWDLPELGCVVQARPTMSRALHVQMIGRVLRPHPGKPPGVVIDHAGNHPRHGFAWEDLEYTLDEADPIKGEPTGLWTCEVCYAMVPNYTDECPECGYIRPAKIADRIPTHVDGELTEWDEDRSLQYLTDQYRILVATAAQYDYRIGWARNRYKQQYGTWPSRAMKSCERELYRCDVHEWENAEWGVRCKRCLRPQSARQPS